MLTLSTTQRKLLGLLAQNARLTDTALANALRVSHDAVAHAIKRLTEEKVIQSFNLMIDARCLGFTRYHLLLRLECNTQLREQYIKRVSKHPAVMWVNSFVGCYDLQIIIDALSALELNEIIQQLFKLCEHKVKRYTILTHLSDLEFTNLFPAIDIAVRFDRDNDSSFAPYITRRSYGVSKEFVRYYPDARDMAILAMLSDSPRVTITTLAEQIGTDRVTTRKRILKLIQQGVIRSFACIIDKQLFGYTTYYLLVRFHTQPPEAVIKRPFKELTNIFYAGEMLGDYNLILYLNASSPQELNSSIDLMRKHLEHFILDYELLVQESVHAWRHVTPYVDRHGVSIA
jgi:Lrp/AsnC family leucine-responsive transcriptional regulator